MKYCKSLAVAQRIVFHMMNGGSKYEDDDSWYVECFDNCREQGLVITNGRIRIAVAENRNSDNIVVYVYKDVQFPSNLPREDQWNSTFFDYDDYGGAMKFIEETMDEYSDKNI